MLIILYIISSCIEFFKNNYYYKANANLTLNNQQSTTFV